MPRATAQAAPAAFRSIPIGINVGAVTGPLACGLLAQLYGWHAGFGLAGVLMLCGLATYLLGYRTLTQETVKSQSAERRAPLTAAQRRVILGLVG